MILTVVGLGRVNGIHQSFTSTVTQLLGTALVDGLHSLPEGRHDGRNPRGSTLLRAEHVLGTSQKLS